MIEFQNQRPDPMRRLVRKAAEIVPMSWIRPRVVVRIDREVFRLSRGRTTLSALVSGLRIVEMHARELKDAERQRYVDLGIEVYPWWEPYHRRAVPRQIPVIMLEPV